MGCLRKTSFTSSATRGRTFETAMVRAAGLKAVPPWLTDEQKQLIFAIYEAAEALHMATSKPHEADHLAQPVGKNKACEQVIRGLQVLSNLRATPWKMNRCGGDWFDIVDAEGDEPSEDEILASF